MGRKIVILLSILGFVLISGIWFYSPREVDVRLEGVKYRLGSKNASEIEPVTILIEGTVRRTLKGHRLFRGTVELEGKPMLVPKEKMTNRTFTARRGEGYLLIYQWFEGGAIGKSVPFGTLYADDYFREITLTLFEQRKDSQSWLWNGGDGLMVTAPAKNRTEGLRIANKLMAESLKESHPLS